jgi:hypothetical protein
MFDGITVKPGRRELRIEKFGEAWVRRQKP